MNQKFSSDDPTSIKDISILLLNVVSEKYEGKELFNNKRNLVQEAYESGNLKKLKKLLQETLMMAYTESPNVKEKINTELNSIHSINLDDIKINNIVKKDNTKNIEEYTFIKDWALTILEYIESILPEKDRHAITIGKESWNTFYDQRIFKGFTEGYRDMNEWGRQLNPAQQAELNRILRSKFGKDLNDATDKTHKKLTALLKKGKITTEEEYRIVEARIDEIFQDETKKGEVEALNALLIGYHNTHKK